MILTLACGAYDATYHVYHKSKLVGVLIDHPVDLDRTVVFDAGLERILADVRSGNMDDCLQAIREDLNRDHA